MTIRLLGFSAEVGLVALWLPLVRFVVTSALFLAQSVETLGRIPRDCVESSRLGMAGHEISWLPREVLLPCVLSPRVLNRLEAPFFSFALAA